MSLKDVLVPDIGNFDFVDVIEVLVKAGDTIAKDDSLMTVESDKASMDIPAPFAGVVKEVKIKVGDKVAQGHLILVLDASDVATEAKVEVAATAPAEAPKTVIPEPSRPAPEPVKQVQPAHQPAPVGEHIVVAAGALAHASPSVRKFARELGVNLALVKVVHQKPYCCQWCTSVCKGELAKPRTENMGAGLGALATLAMPVIDFSKFGEVETKPLSRIKNYLAQTCTATGLPRHTWRSLMKLI